MAMDEARKILKEIKGGNLKPIYFLMGDEAYFIDVIADFIANTVLTEEERGFNQITLYGKEVAIDDIVANAKRFPMMAEHQVIIVKEAQHLARTIDLLEAYALQPLASTVLVVCYKYKKLDKRKAVYKALAKNGLVFESKKLYENQVAQWLRKQVGTKGFTLSEKANAMLVEYLGTDLSRLHMELEKLYLIALEGKQITPDIIERHIGISKDYNNFELKKAIGERNMDKMAKIINYFSQNPKDNPFVVTIGTLQTFFTQLLQYHGLQDKSKNNVASVLRINPYFVNEYAVASRNFPMKRVSQIISRLRTLDLKSKGVGAQNMGQADLLKELLYSMG